MNKIIHTIIISSCILLSGINLLGQNCKKYENKCPPPPKGFKLSSTSKSFSLKKMKKVNLKLTFYGDRAYYISTTGKPKLGKIHFRLIEADENRTILYDNAADSFATNKIFEIESTLNVIIEVSAPTYQTDRIRECAAVLIAYQKL